MSEPQNYAFLVIKMAFLVIRSPVFLNTRWYVFLEKTTAGIKDSYFCRMVKLSKVLIDSR